MYACSHASTVGGNTPALACLYDFYQSRFLRISVDKHYSQTAQSGGVDGTQRHALLGCQTSIRIATREAITNRGKG